MKLKQKTMYEIREFVSSLYSKRLGRRLRSRRDAMRIAKILKKQGREIIVYPFRITVAA